MFSSPEGWKTLLFGIGLRLSAVVRRSVCLLKKLFWKYCRCDGTGDWITTHQDSLPGPVWCLSLLTLKQPSALHSEKQIWHKTVAPDMSHIPLSSHPAKMKGSSTTVGHARPWDSRETQSEPLPAHCTRLKMLPWEAVLKEPSRLSGCYVPKPTAHPSNSRNWKKWLLSCPVSAPCSPASNPSRIWNPSFHQILLMTLQPWGQQMTSDNRSLLSTVPKHLHLWSCLTHLQTL